MRLFTAITDQEADSAQRDAIFVCWQAATGEELLGTILDCDGDGVATVDVLGYRNDGGGRWRLKLYGPVTVHRDNLRFVQAQPSVQAYMAAKKASFWGSPKLEVVHTSEGEYGNNSHMTRVEKGTLPIIVAVQLAGKKRERRDWHTVNGEQYFGNYPADRWRAFVDDVKKHGIREPVFVVVEWVSGSPKAFVYEGNHRIAAAVQADLDTIPVEVRYFGHAEQDYMWPEKRPSLYKKKAAAGEWYYRLSTMGAKLPTSYSYGFEEDAAPGFQVWIHPWQVLSAILGYDMDGTYSPQDGYNDLLLVRAESVRDSVDPWYAILPDDVLETRIVDARGVQQELTNTLEERFGEDWEYDAQEWLDDNDDYFAQWLLKQSRPVSVQWVETLKTVTEGKAAMAKEKSFTISRRCLCDAYGLPCTGTAPVTFKRTKKGWKVDGELSPIDDVEAKRLYEECQKKGAAVVQLGARGEPYTIENAKLQVKTTARDEEEAIDEATILAEQYPGHGFRVTKDGKHVQTITWEKGGFSFKEARVRQAQTLQIVDAMLPDGYHLGTFVARDKHYLQDELFEAIFNLIGMEESYPPDFEQPLIDDYIDGVGLAEEDFLPEDAAEWYLDLVQYRSKPVSQSQLDSFLAKNNLPDLPTVMRAIEIEGFYEVAPMGMGHLVENL